MSGVAAHANVSRFVDAGRTDVAAHMYPRDPALLEAFKGPGHRLAFIKHLLAAYQQDWQFEMPEVVRVSSREYLDDNDPFKAFIDTHVWVGGLCPHPKPLHVRSTCKRCRLDWQLVHSERCAEVVGRVCHGGCQLQW